MAPSSMTSRSEVPKTPAKIGTTPGSSPATKQTPKQAKSSPATPRKPPKLGPPKSASKITAAEQGNNNDVQIDSARIAENKATTSRPSASERSSSPYQKIDLKDNDSTSRSHDGDEADGTSMADSTGLQEAQPQPIEDDENSEAASRSPNRVGNAAQGSASESEDAAEEADNETEKESLHVRKLNGGKSSSGSENLKNKVRDKATNTGSPDQHVSSDKGRSQPATAVSKHESREVEDQAHDATSDVEEQGERAADKASKATNEARELSQEDSGRPERTAETGQQAPNDAQDVATNAADAVKETSQRPPDAKTDSVQDSANELGHSAQDTTEDVGDLSSVKEAGDDTTGDTEDKIDSGTEDITSDTKSRIPDTTDDLASLKGLKVQENGEIHDEDGNIIGKLEEGDPSDLQGYEVGDDGEILDEDGDVVGRVSLFPRNAATEDAQEAARDLEDQIMKVSESGKQAMDNTYIPDMDVLNGLEVGEDGNIHDHNGNILGRITEGDPADLVGMTLNEDGEVLDEDGDVVGRAETLPQEKREEARPKGQIPSLDALEGLAVTRDGTIKDDQGNTLGKITDGDPQDLEGMKLNADGEILDEDGDVIGRAEIVPEAGDEFGDSNKDAAPGMSQEVMRLQALEEQLKPNLDIVEGRKLNKRGNILDDEGEVLAKLIEGDVKACAGRLPNENGEILDDKGKVIGQVEVVSGEAAEEAMRAAHPALIEELAEAQKAADEAEIGKDGTGETAAGVEDTADYMQHDTDQISPDLSQLEGLKVNKKGEVLNEDGEPIARLSEGELDNARGKRINHKGEVVDQDGNVVGKVEFIPEAIEQGLVEADEEAEPLATSILEGYRVNKNGDVLNEDGDVIARLSEGSLDDVVGKKLDSKGEVVDQDGNVIGKVELTQDNANGDAAAEEDDDLPSLSILKGLAVNKSGKVVNHQGTAVGELVEGNAKKIWKSGATADDKGQFWDGQGNVVGRAKTIPAEDETEGDFSGLDGLIVAKDGWVEDDNGNRVGKIVEGDPKKLVGRAVDEDGDIIDKRGNVVGHAERYEEAEAEDETAPVDLSELKGLTSNKQGNVIGPDGVPIARLIEGNPKELAGRKIDDNGQIWNDAGKVVGRCELIPQEEREAKLEGPFAGLQGLVVVQDGFVEDEDGHVVGIIKEGDAKKLLGRTVDEDGDVVDKYGNVKGHAEPYETPEEERDAPEDLSSLAGKTVNKQGKIVDEHGTIFGEVLEGSIKRLSGCKVDAQGQIWSNDGKVIGRAGLITGGDDGRAEGPFSNFESTTVSKDGLVKDSAGDIVGRVIEGDPKKLVGRHVDDDGDILDKNGNVIGKAERWEPEEKTREVNPMAGLRVNKQGEVRDQNGEIVGRLTEGNLLRCIGREVDDNGYVVDQDGNKLGEVTLLENIADDEEEEEAQVEEGPTDEEVQKQEEREIAKKIGSIVNQTIEKMEPICKQIDEAVEKADRTPREELDEEALVNQVKPLIEEGGRILSECNGSIRGLDPDGHIAAQAKARHASGEATPEEHRVAEGLKELTGSIVKCIDNAKKKIADMPHAKKKLSPLWGLLTEPLFQIIAAVGLLLTGVLGLVGKLLNGLGLGGLVNGILGGLGINKLLDGVGLGSVTEGLGLGGGKKK